MLDGLERSLALLRLAREQHGAAQADTLAKLEAALAATQSLATMLGPAAVFSKPAAAPALAMQPEAASDALMPQAMIELDMAGYLCAWDAGAERLFGYSGAEAIGQHVLFLYAEDDDTASIAELFYDTTAATTEVRRRTKAGQVCWFRLALTPLMAKEVHACEGGRDDGSDDGHDEHEPLGMRVCFVPFGAPPAEQLSALDQQRLHARIVEDSEQGVLITDAHERIVSINSAFTRITGYGPAEALGQSADLLRSGVPDADFHARLRTAMAGQAGWRGEIIGKRKHGELFPQTVAISVLRDARGQVTHTFSLFSDISVHKDAEARMQRMANYDSLTGLPNRGLLTQLLDQALTEARRTQDHGALMVIDISRIGAISDTLGHEVGDALLVEIGRLFRLVLRDADILARIEGNKFMVALLHIEKREHAAIVAQKLLAALEAPIRLDTHSLQVGAAIGITVYPEDGLDTPSLIRGADVAVAKAGQNVESSFLFYREEMNQRAKEHLRLESELRLALLQNELQLHYQPKVSLRSGRIVGAEALLRWKHPIRGLVSPAVFIPVAEETGLILELGSWVLDEACRQIRAWKDAGLVMPPIAVNLSARQFDRNLPARIATVLERHGVRPEQIMLEITESLLMRGADHVITIMNELVAMGLALALDDFGTGYSSLAYLKKFPISTLKIDRSFVIGLPYEENDCAIARAIVTMAQQLRQEIVAEGVETAEQMNFLRELGCDQLQGYLFSPAVAAADFAQMLREGQRLVFSR